MTPYAVLMFCFSGAMLIMGFLVSHGGRDLIRSFRFTKVRDKKEYEKYLGKSIAACAMAPILSGICDLFLGTLTSFLIFLISLIVILVLIAKKSKQHYR